MAWCIKMLMSLEVAHAFYVSIFGGVEHLRHERIKDGAGAQGGGHTVSGNAFQGTTYLSPANQKKSLRVSPGN